MKKLGQKAGAIGALLFALIPAFFMAACSTDGAGAVDAAAVTAELKAEKAKYQTAVNLYGQQDNVNVIEKVVKVLTGSPDPAITQSIPQTSNGLMILSETGSLTIQKVDTEAVKKADGYEAGTPTTDAWEREIQVVTLKFEKAGVASYLDVLAGFADLSTAADIDDSWVVYGYDQYEKVPKKPVLDLEKLKNANWVESSGGRESLKHTVSGALAALAAQDFIDDVVSGMSTGELVGVYGDSGEVRVVTCV